MNTSDRMRLVEFNLFNESRNLNKTSVIYLHVDKTKCKRIARLQVLLSALKYWAEFVIAEVFHVRFYL